MHSGSLYYILAAAGLYSFDHFTRLLRTRYTIAWLTPKHALNGGTTLVHVPSLGAGWRAGQHVRIRVVSNEWFGWWASWFDRARPFTIAGSDRGGMVLLIKANGRWTRNLLRTASETANAQAHPYMRSTNSELGLAPARKVRVAIEGPYGKQWVFPRSVMTLRCDMPPKVVLATRFTLRTQEPYSSLVAVAFHM
jgi:ferric-chelate reductase